MLDTYFEAAATLARLRTGPFGPFMDGFAGTLCAVGYGRWTARGFLRGASHLGFWMQRTGISAGALSEDTISTFADHLPVCDCLRRNKGIYGDAVIGARMLLAYLRTLGVAPASPVVPVKALSGHIVGFERWMMVHRGVQPSTLLAYRMIALELLAALGEPTAFQARSLRRFVSDRAAQHGRSRAKTVVTATRMFLRYAIAHGLCAVHLDTSIPTIAEWKLGTLPRYLGSDDVERLLATPDLSRPAGLRDHAILLLLARLGLRAGDVVALRFDDIDWAAGTLRVAGKGRQTTRLPMPQDVGDAVKAYLDAGRPDALEPQVFLRVRAPYGSLHSSSAVSGIVKRTARQAGIKLARGGAHLLRHSLATRLVREGVPLVAVRTVLRHQSDQMTAHYAKLDTPALARLAQPWPQEVAP